MTSKLYKGIYKNQIAKRKNPSKKAIKTVQFEANLAIYPWQLFYAMLLLPLYCTVFTKLEMLQ